jgi:hypothetical protein
MAVTSEESISYVLAESSPGTLTGVKKSLTTLLETSGNRINQDLAEEWRDIETQLESLSS